MTTIIPVSCQPDSISFLPNSDDILVATYTYNEGVRSGSLLTLKRDECVSNQCKYNINSQLMLNYGILHAKPHITNGKIYSICAASDGSIKYAILDQDISIEASISLDSNALVLSICKDSITERVIGGLSNGKLALIDQDRILSLWTGHDLEIWSCYMDGNLIYTGSDDSRLRIWDVNTLYSNDSFIGEIRSFGAGVTWISSSENEIIAGSHDNYLRWFDKRSLNNEVKRIKLPGSPWKLVFDDSIFYAAVCQGFIYAFTIEDRHEDRVVKINERLGKLSQNLPQGIHDLLIYSIDVRDDILLAADFYNRRLMITDLL